MPWWLSPSAKRVLRRRDTDVPCFHIPDKGSDLETVVVEGALLLLDLRSAATHCFLCAWFNEYVRFGERDQLSFAYVAYTQRPRLRLNLLPRRIHWSVTVEDDTMRCYNATEADAAQLAVRFQHNRPDQKTGRPVVRAAALPRGRGRPKLA